MDEPVAWGVFEGNLHDMFFSQEEAQKMAELKGTHAEVRPLYITPQQRTWIGLTDDEVWEAYMESPVELDCSTDELYAISRTVEAKLKGEEHMTDLTEANLKDYITAIQKHIEERGKVMAIKPTKVMYLPGDLEKIGLTHEDVLKMIKEKNT